MKDNKEIIEEIMFFSPIYLTKLLDIDNKKIEKESYDIKNKKNSELKSNFGGWQSPATWQYEDLEKTEILKLLKKIKECVNEISKMWDIETQIDNFWININGKNNFNNTHIHPQSKMSGVYYVKCNSKSGNIVFKRPDNQLFCIPGSSENKYRFGSYQFLPSESLLVIFPSHLEHYVEPNTSDCDRISIAFNFS